MPRVLSPADQELAYRRQQATIAEYFDRSTPVWTALTSKSPVSRIRQSVREGREEMRATLVGWLPSTLAGTAILDAGCGTGALAIAAANRGARVLGVDLAEGLIREARRRAGEAGCSGRARFVVGDMIQQVAERYDYVVAMDSLIHYRANEAITMVGRLAALARTALLFTLVPGSPLLRAKRLVGRFFPRSDRAPAVEPIKEAEVRRRLATHSALVGWRLGRTQVVRHGFYTSQAYELLPR